MKKDVLININNYADVLLRTQMISLPFAQRILDLGAGSCVLKDVYPFLDSVITFTDLEDSESGTFQLSMKKYIDTDPNARCSNFKFVETSCTDLSMFEDNSFELVVFSHVIEHLTEEEIDSTLKEIKRVLVPKGNLVVVTPNKTARIIVGTYMAHADHIEEFTGEELVEMLEKYGFVATNNNRSILKVTEDNGKQVLEMNVHNDINTGYFTFLYCENTK